MKRILILVVAVLAALAGASPAGAATAIGGGGGGGAGTADAWAPAADGGPQDGEAPLGSFVSPASRGGGVSRGPGGLRVDPTCAVQCITGGLAYGRGPDARLVVTTDVPATIRIVVSGPAGYTRQLISASGRTSFSALFDDLTADSPYQASVLATDAHGNSAVRAGSFRTLRRNVRVLFNEADIATSPFDESGPYGAETWFEGEQVAEVVGHAEAGELHLGAQQHAEQDTDRFLSLGIELSQQAAENDHACEVENPYVPAINIGWNDCEYSTVAWLDDGSFDLDARPLTEPDANDYILSGTMTLPNAVEDPALPGGYGSPLVFTVPVAVQVTWTHT